MQRSIQSYYVPGNSHTNASDDTIADEEAYAQLRSELERDSKRCEWIADEEADEAEGKRKKRASEQDDGFSWLTERNLEHASLRFRAEHGIASDLLEDTLAAMQGAGWRLSPQLRDRGIHNTFYAQFTAACNGRTIYTAEYFAGLRRDCRRSAV